MSLAALLQRKSARILVATLAGLLGAMALAASGALGRIENILFDQRTRALAGIPADRKPPIEIILLDQASLDWAKAELGWGWPWPREAYAKITDYCATAGARVVVFDVLFTEPSIHGVEDDLAFGHALRKQGNAVIAGMPHPQFKSPGSAPPQALRLPTTLVPPPSLAGFAVTPWSIDAIATNAWSALAFGTPDPDGVFRRAPLWGWVGAGDRVASLGVAAALLSHFPGVEENLARLCRESDYSVATLRVRGTSDDYQAWSAASVLQSALKMEAGEAPTVPVTTLKDKIVFFGFSAPGLLDLRPTPLNPKEAGVMSHVTLAGNLISGDWLRRVHPGAWWLFMLLATLASAAGMTLARQAWLGVTGMAILAALPVLISLAAFRANVDLPASGIMAAVLVSAFTALSLNYATEGRQKAFLKAAFAHYLSPEVIERLIASPDQLRLGGERKELTMFFSDLEGFSSFSEKLSPEKLTSVLNAFLTEMTEIVLAEGGTLDKYIGDAIVAFWNAPLPQPDHALRAVRAALACQARIRERQEEWFRDYGVRLRMRIGINTGEVVVGNMGSDRRFDYTMLGDAANLASRLEGANKVFHTYLLISDSTRAALGDRVPCRELGGLKVVGREAALRVHEPVTARTPAHAEYERGLALLRAGDLAAASEVFAGLPDDPAAQATLEECRRHLESGTAWDGIWRPSGK